MCGGIGSDLSWVSTKGKKAAPIRKTKRDEGMRKELSKNGSRKFPKNICWLEGAGS